MASSASNKANRIFIKNGRRHYRRLYSSAETRAGAAIIVLLFLVAAWVAWRGAHPDPSLFMLETDLSQGGASASATAVDRGPVPSGLAAEGWHEGELSTFDYDDLFVKIDGREGFYKSFGFQMLYFLSIILSDDPQTAVDIELYDLGSSANAVGAYSGERTPDVAPVASESGLSHIERNALFLTSGRYYLRAIGSEESPVVLAELEHLRERFQAELPAEPLPWGYALFAGRMGLSPGDISYASENAFSFGFAGNVYSVPLADGAELFVTPSGSEEEARELAGRYLDGFRRYGADEGRFVKDRYQGKFATAAASGPWVVGFLRASDTDAAVSAMEKLAAVVKDLPPPAPAPETKRADELEDEFQPEDYGSDEY